MLSAVLLRRSQRFALKPAARAAVADDPGEGFDALLAERVHEAARPRPPETAPTASPAPRRAAYHLD
ncbi:MAG TPA: hypothetical protein DDY78_22135 [Planctomycetales bacterium]|jgi:hypothetical protein|nr:hypothetical protein [Planctomycetales bacterium]